MPLMDRLLILPAAEVHRLLSIERCIDVMQAALVSVSEGRAFQPLRSLVRAPGEKGFLGLMPAHHRGNEIGYGLKAVAVFPDNPARGLDSHLGAVLLYDVETGALRAVMDASAITEIRTAAVSAVATRALARKDAADVAIIGSGIQARAHLHAMAAVRKIRRARIFSTSPESAREMVSRSRELPIGEISVAPSAELAVRDAGIIVTATSSATPVLEREWISAGAHLNVIGSSVRTKREIDGRTLAAARLFVDRTESALNESGEVLMAIEEGAINKDHIRGELGDLLLGRIPGRTTAEEITIFKSLGLAIEDLAAGEFLYRTCVESGEGTWVGF